MSKKFTFLSFFLFLVLQFVTTHSKITLLTRPIGNGSQNLHDSGHFGVTRSIYEGLKRLNMDFNYNPINTSDVGEFVLVLSDFHALRQAIDLKNAGKVKKILVGPNMAGSPLEERGLLMANEIDTILVPSEWVADAQKKLDIRLRNKIKIWPAGVNEVYWDPVNKNYDSKIALIYCKNCDNNLLNNVQTILQNNGWRVEIIKYGNHNHSQFKEALLRAKFAVFLSTSESQGLALAESWSMDVPTLVWERGGTHLYCGVFYAYISSAPYLSKSTGLFWSNINQFSEIILNINDNLLTFKPRKWVLNNMTDLKTTQKLLDLFEKS